MKKNLPMVQTPKATDRAASGHSSLTALAAGLVVDVGGSILTTNIFAFSLAMFGATSGFFWPGLFYIWSIVIGLAGLFGGAYVAARMSPSRPLLHAAIIGLADLVLTFAMVPAGAISTLLMVYAALVLPAACAAGTIGHWANDIETKQLERAEKRKFLT